MFEELDPWLWLARAKDGKKTIVVTATTYQQARVLASNSFRTDLDGVLVRVVREHEEQQIKSRAA